MGVGQGKGPVPHGDERGEKDGEHLHEDDANRCFQILLRPFYEDSETYVNDEC